MNIRTLSAFMLLISPGLIIGCSEQKQERNNQSAAVSTLALHADDDNAFTIDPKATVITWKGSSIQGAHDGYAHVSKGELLFTNGELTGGAVEIDMNKSEGPGHDKDNNLINHLKSEDFFDVKKFPFSTFTITGVQSIDKGRKKVTGNLSIKGITHPVTFPASIEVAGGIVKANASMVIDRTQWGIKYKSGKFFDNLKDQAIADSIEFGIKIIAKR